MKKPHEPLIAFPKGCILARFRTRKNRFHVVVEKDGALLGVHCNNSGSMLGLLRAGEEAMISPAMRPGRKLPYTLELLRPQGFWVGVNTMVPNRLLFRAWEARVLPETLEYTNFRPEAVTGQSRLDALLTGPPGRLWVEAKNVTLVEDDVAYFPDAVTERGQKHLRELIDLAHRGHRVACFYLIQRPDASCFAPADFIDPAFADLFRHAMEAGVEAWPYQAVVSPEGIALGSRLPVLPLP